MPRLRTALPRWLAPTLLACASASATAAPVWVSMDEAALRVLQSQRIDHDAVERHAVAARRDDAALGQPDHRRVLMRRLREPALLALPAER